MNLITRSRVSDGVFSAGDENSDEAIFHPALDLDNDDIKRVQEKIRYRGLRCLTRHHHLDADAAGGADDCWQ